MVDAPSEAAAARNAGNQAGAWGSLPILILLYALSLLDRQVLNLLVGPIKRDLSLSDFQVGMLQGLVFALFYSVASIPIGWLVDRFPRRPIIWVGVTLWGIAATACGLAQSFWQLLFARLGVGAGEASLSPAAYSMLADLFRPSRLALALSTLIVGSSIGNGLAIGLGGAIVNFAQTVGTQQLPLIGAVKPWQFVFIVTGLPGLVMGALIFLIREPARRDRLATGHPPLSETFRFLHERRRFFIAHFVGFGLLSVVGWGFTSWLPTYMARAFGWSIGDLSLPLALMAGIGGALGTLISGSLVDRLFGGGRLDAHLWAYVIIGLGSSALGAVAFQVSNPTLFLVLVTPVVSFAGLAAIAVAALQIVCPNQMRGQVSAMFLLVSNGIGLALGPMIVGALTDFVFRDEARLGSSISLLFAVAGPLGVGALMLGLRPMRDAVRTAEAWRS